MICDAAIPLRAMRVGEEVEVGAEAVAIAVALVLHPLAEAVLLLPADVAHAAPLDQSQGQGQLRAPDRPQDHDQDLPRGQGPPLVTAPPQGRGRGPPRGLSLQKAERIPAALPGTGLQPVPVPKAALKKKRLRKSKHLIMQSPFVSASHLLMKGIYSFTPSPLSTSGALSLVFRRKLRVLGCCEHRSITVYATFS
mmetsp:Transcript_27947/g.33944  ORF Transcript_27947/g.33944 Transcript_27947/m.33944 type:complete len:195 (-) Transcript_27947:162-746(-)